jgi:hypothetical protein
MSEREGAPATYMAWFSCPVTVKTSAVDPKIFRWSRFAYVILYARASICDSNRRRQFITNRTARTQDNKNVGRKQVTHWHRREREKKRERERNLKGRKTKEGGHGSAEARRAEGQAEM